MAEAQCEYLVWTFFIPKSRCVKVRKGVFHMCIRFIRGGVGVAQIRAAWIGLGFAGPLRPVAVATHRSHCRGGENQNALRR